MENISFQAVEGGCPKEANRKRLSGFVTGMLDLELGEGGEGTDVFPGWISKETSMGP